MSDEPDLGLTPEQEALRDVVRRFVSERSPREAVRALIDTHSAGDPAVWKTMAEELGLHAIAIPEEYGGAGCGAVELGIVLEEMGRLLLVSPFFSTIALASQTLLQFEDEDARQRWLPAFAAGSTTATVAIAENAGRWDLESVEARAERTEGGWAVSGSKWFVPDGCTADVVFVAARTETGLGLFAVESGAPGVERVSLQALDLTRDLARIELDHTPAVPVEEGVDASERLESALDAIYVAVACEQIGGAGRCLDMAVDYARTRTQFDRPIGSFQAIKHKCVDILLDLEAGRSAAYYARAAIAARASDAPAAASVAKAYCSQAFVHAAKENIQIHGGIGYTWEHDAHLYLRRAKSSELLFGSPVDHRARLARLIGLAA